MTAPSALDEARGVRNAGEGTPDGACCHGLFSGSCSFFDEPLNGELELGNGRRGAGDDEPVGRAWSGIIGAPSIAFHVEFEDARPMRVPDAGRQRACACSWKIEPHSPNRLDFVGAGQRSGFRSGS